MELSILIIAIVSLAASVVTLGVVAVLLHKQRRPQQNDEALRRELERQLNALADAVSRQMDTYAKTSAQQAEQAETRAAQQQHRMGEQLNGIGENMQRQLQAQRMEMEQKLENIRTALDAKQQQSLALTETRLNELRQEVATQLGTMREDNNRQLERMRKVVDEQLQENLQTHLSQSFAAITENLQKVYQGLGEMQALTTGMNDLRKVLSGVKTRGVWGEASLARLLEDILAAEQYDTNVHTSPRTDRSVVEFAVKLPGAGDGTVYMPIDSKFPKEDYERLVACADQGDRDGMEAASKALEARVKSEAKDIAVKYIHPPRTTDFAVMYLPIEGLYAEVVRHAGLVEYLRNTYKVMVAGPTTLAALLNSLQVGFRTLAVEKRSKEIWDLLATVQRLFGQFARELEHAEQQVDRVAKTIRTTTERSKRIGAKLQGVQQLTSAEVDESLLIAADETQGDEE